MGTAIDWIVAHWLAILAPAAVFFFALFILLWLRRRVSGALKAWPTRAVWEGSKILLEALRWPSLIWCLIVSLYLGLVASEIPAEWKSPSSSGLWTIFVISLSFAVFRFANGLILLYGRRYRLPWRGLVVARNIARIVVLIVTVLAVLEIWGVHTSTIALLVAVMVLAAAFAFRDAIANLVAGSQLGAAKQIKVGDHIKLEAGVEGLVSGIRWNNTHIKALDGSTIIIPNSRLLRQTVINYGHPLKKAKEPFRFNSRTHLTELTGLKAANLRELHNILKTAPDAMVYYHTHHFLQEHHYLTPELSNDFAVWATDALGEEALGERLASVNTFEFATLGTLRDRLASILGEYLASESALREAMDGREFYFMKSVSVIFALPDVAHDLREFVEALRKISTGSLYFHIFESRLRLGRGLNDFTIWLKDSLGEEELGEEIARLDPYTYTLEGLRQSLIQLVKKHIP